ncbi:MULTISPECIES: glycosyltransferase family 2 protein [Paracoccaceae]|jgi:glycosyltransferase involved in cell wall biosynthesis|uniref:glycosyltransferase family 2 protein n=1 Tax=Rhodobacterales TaxID=204455 RepID=UPI001D0A3C3B|nr:glycosyltransferase family A protein [Boseongicola sp. H5]
MAKLDVAVPTFNRAELLREALICLRDQDYEEFKVTVFDNASNDNTREVVLDEFMHDPRFEYRRNDMNIGPGANFQLALHQSEAEYFMWRADDDLSDPTYVGALLRCLEDDPSLELAYSSCEQVTENSRKLVEAGSRRDEDPGRVVDLLLDCKPTWVYGMWRRTALQSNRRAFEETGYPFLWASDHLILLPSLLKGAAAPVPDTRFIQRIIGSADYALQPREQLQARAEFRWHAHEMMEQLTDPSYRSEIATALEHHIEQRVGRKWSLRRRILRGMLRL